MFSPELPPSQGACHCLGPHNLASRSPVKASLRLSVFGLDGAPTAMPETLSTTRQWQALSAWAQRCRLISAR